MSKAYVIHFISPLDLIKLSKLFPYETWLITAVHFSCTLEELRQIKNFQEIRQGNYT